MPNRIRKDDQVVVISGKDKGKRGRVMLVLLKKDKVVVEGLNMMTRHKRPNPQNPAAGGRVRTEAAMPTCKVMPWSEADQKGVRIRIKTDEKGKRYRVSSKSGEKLAAAGAATATPRKTKDKPQEGKKS